MQTPSVVGSPVHNLHMLCMHEINKELTMIVFDYSQIENLSPAAFALGTQVGSHGNRALSSSVSDHLLVPLNHIDSWLHSGREFYMRKHATAII